MRKIDTEHGPVYIAEAGEDDSSYAQLKVQGVETKQLGESMWLDPERFRISGPFMALVCVCMLVAGFGIGSYFHDSSSTRVTLIISFTILLFVIRGFRNTYLGYESAYMETLDEHRAAEHILLDKKMAVEAHISKQLETATKLQGKGTKGTKTTYDFTSNDFDNSAVVILMKIVKQARKARAKVTGQGLIATILKGIR